MSVFHSPLSVFHLFTGIIEASANVLQKTDSTLQIERPAQFDDLSIGASVAINGVCLSVTVFDDASMSFDVVAETWEKSNLGELAMGDSVHVERATPANGRLDGHIVQGHCEGVASVEGIPEGENPFLVIQMSDELIKFCVQKGAIAIDGVSLTIAKVDGNLVSVALVPHTMKVTHFGDLSVGDSVNIETDIVGRYCYSFVHASSSL